MRERLRRAAAGGLLALAACTPIATTKSAGQHALHAWTQPDRLRIGSSEEPDSLNKLIGNSDASDQIANLLFAPVLRYNERGDFIPEMATVVPSVENGGLSRDGRRITFHFRHGMQWSDGAPLDARDLRFTWRAVMNPRNNTRLRVGWEEITAMDLPDTTTAVIHLRRPYASILGIFAIGGAGYPPLPEHLLAAYPDINHVPFNSAPISSGPWLLHAWHHGAGLEFDANPRYFRGAPKIAHLEYRIIPNADTLIASLRTHEIDVDDSVTENQIPIVERLDGITTVKRTVANLRHLTLNTREPELRDVRVRRAVALAVDWDRMNATIYHGYNERAVSPIMPTSWAAPTAQPWRVDRERAAHDLAAAGWILAADGYRYRSGHRLTLSVSTTPAKQANVQAEVQMQQDLHGVGIDLEIKNYPSSLLLARDGPLYTGHFSMALTMDTLGPDPDNEGDWSGAAIPPAGANTTFLNDPLLTQVSSEAAHTIDRAARKRLYQQQTDRIHALVPAVFLYWQSAVAAYNSDLHGYKPAQFFTSTWNSWEWSFS